MVDKYAHLRPRLDRQCHRADRVPKKRYPQQDLAEAAAARHRGYHAYECPCCGWWHTGRDTSPKAREARVVTATVTEIRRRR